MASTLTLGQVFILVRKVCSFSRRHCRVKPHNVLILHIEELDVISVFHSRNNKTENTTGNFIFFFKQIYRGGGNLP